jgi:site-specific recombinase XerD
MTLTEKLEHVMRERSLARTTRSNYHGWVKAFYQFNRTPASQWTGEMLSQWLGHLHRLDYSAGSRKQALCAVVFVFRHVLQREIGNLNLPPMPRVRQTLRVVPSREELGRIFAGLKGQAKLMAGLMYGSGLPIHVRHDYVHKHKPEAGGYYVVYADGYKSYSPAKAFEEGYTLA